jgi:hypothetical protein
VLRERGAVLLLPTGELSPCEVEGRLELPARASRSFASRARLSVKEPPVVPVDGRPLVREEVPKAGKGALELVEREDEE